MKGIGSAIKNFIVLQGAKILAIIAIPIILFVTIAGLYQSTTTKVQDKISELFSDVTNNVEIKDGKLEIKEDYLTDGKKKLKTMGIDPKTIGLDGYEDYLTKFLEAEIMTNYPHLGDEGIQGAVYFERAGYDGTTTELKYMDYNEFYKKNQDENQRKDLRNYFTVDPKDWTVHVQSLNGENGTSIEKIDYKSMVSRFAMPFEFPIALAQITQNPPFCLAVVNLVKKSRIVITIAETKITTKTDVSESHDRTTETFNASGVKVASSSEKITTNVSSKTEVSYSSTTFLSYAHVWIADYGESPQYKDHTEVNKVTKKLPDTSSRSASDQSSTYTTTTNGVETTVITTRTQEWVQGKTDINSNIGNFTNLILRKSNVSTYSGDGIVGVAKKCYDAIVDSKRFHYGATVGGIPIDVTKDTRVDCSGYVSWVLYEAGYKDMAGHQHTSETIGPYGKSKGWQVINNINDTQPGDICIWPGHVNIVASIEPDGTRLYYDCGTDAKVTGKKRCPVKYYRTGLRYAVRPNDAIANSLGTAKTSDDLKDKIEKYINENIKDGKYSVSYLDVDYPTKRNEEINDSKVDTNGWLKLFIMATAYSEASKGTVKLDGENGIEGNLGHMIDVDTNQGTSTYAKLVLENLGDGDVDRGIDKVNTYLSYNGYFETHMGSMIKYNAKVGDNYTSVSDVTKLLQSIKDGDCVNAEYSQRMQDMLYRTQRELIAEQDGTIGHKKSEISVGNNKWNIQDAAIVSLDNANYVVAISAQDVSSKDEAKNNIKTIAKMVNDYFKAHGKLKNNEDSDSDSEIKTKLNGERVCYKQRDGRWICPLDNLVEGRELLFKLLARREKTQSYERFMRYVLYLLTGKDYGVTDFDLNELFGDGGFTDATNGIVGNTTQEKVFWKIYDFLRNNHISDEQARIAAAGAMGNIEGESSFRPDAIESPSGEGHGLCQWSFDRKTRLLAYAKAKGVSWKDVSLQLEYLMGELTPGGGCQRICSF